MSRDSVYRRVEARKMPAHKVGRQWKFKVEEVDAWVRSGRADCAAAQGQDTSGGGEGR